MNCNSRGLTPEFERQEVRQQAVEAGRIIDHREMARAFQYDMVHHVRKVDDHPQAVPGWPGRFVRAQTDRDQGLAHFCQIIRSFGKLLTEAAIALGSAFDASDSAVDGLGCSAAKPGYQIR